MSIADSFAQEQKVDDKTRIEKTNEMSFARILRDLKEEFPAQYFDFKGDKIIVSGPLHYALDDRLDHYRSISGRIFVDETEKSEVPVAKNIDPIDHPRYISWGFSPRGYPIWQIINPFLLSDFSLFAQRANFESQLDDVRKRYPNASFFLRLWEVHDRFENSFLSVESLFFDVWKEASVWDAAWIERLVASSINPGSISSISLHKWWYDPVLWDDVWYALLRLLLDIPWSWCPDFRLTSDGSFLSSILLYEEPSPSFLSSLKSAFPQVDIVVVEWSYYEHFERTDW